MLRDMRLLACYVFLQWSAVCLAELASDDPHVRFNCGTKSPVSVAKGFQVTHWQIPKLCF